MKDIHKYIAEFIGTMVLVFVGCGAAATFGSANYLAIAIIFGLAIVFVYYSLGRVSGGHVNPAVSLAMYFDNRMELKEMLMYWAAQVAGALAGSGLLCALLSMIPEISVSAIGLGQNGFDSASALQIPMSGAILIETFLSFIFIFTILQVSSNDGDAQAGGLIIGGVLTMVHIIGLPFTGTSVNPARSLAPALILKMMGVGTALSQVWVFLVSPLLGAIIAATIYKLLAKKI